MFDEISKSIKATLYERVSSPLTGSFIISWIITNWKTVLAIFSSLPIESKIEFIQNLYSEWWYYPVYGLILPLLTAILFILIYPYPTKWLYKYWHKNKIELRNEKIKLDSAQILDEFQSRELHEKINAQQDAFDEVINSKNEKISSLENELNGLKQPEHEELIYIPPSKIDMSDELSNILKIIFEGHNNNDHFMFSDIQERSGLMKTKLDHLINQLLSKELITSYQTYPNNDTVFKLTETGITYSVNAGWTD